MSDSDESAVWFAPVTEEIVRQMDILAHTPFTTTAFRERCREFGWPYEPEPEDEFGFQFHIDEEHWIASAFQGDVLGPVLLPFYYWENYDPDWHDEVGTFVPEQIAYNAAYQQTVETVSAVLGPPLRTGQDDDEDAHRWAVWPRETAFLIVQQAALDLQFGMEINIWLEPCTALPCAEDEFQPTSPLIDWLTNRHVR